MVINGMNKLTLLDYPNHVACIIFTKGCPLKCPYCQNSLLIGDVPDEGCISENEVFDYLNKRKNVLDGLVISGGEPTMQKDLIPFIKKIKSMGLKVKLDTNGFNPSVLKELIDNHLIDYIALDIKNDLDHYANTCGFTKLNLDKLLESIDLIRKSNIDHEFRTTVIRNFHNQDRLLNILSLIGDEDKYYLQNFRDSEFVIDHSLEGFSKKELLAFQKELARKHKKISVRGI